MVDRNSTMLIPEHSDHKEIINHNFYFLRVTILAMTQEEFADWLNITRNMVNSYEREEATPSLNVLVTLDENLNIDINRFIKEPITIDTFREFLRTPEETLNYIDTIAKTVS